MMVGAALCACSRLVEIPGPQFSFDPNAAYGLGLGWGSGWEGLETFELSPDGTLVLIRRHGDGWQRAVATLAADQLASVTRAVVTYGVASFHRLYEDPGVHDGEQWVLCLEQGGRRRVVYCNNHFAPGIRAFRDACWLLSTRPLLVGRRGPTPCCASKGRLCGKRTATSRSCGRRECRTV
jgi:hypothetical protein